MQLTNLVRPADCSSAVAPVSLMQVSSCAFALATAVDVAVADLAGLPVPLTLVAVPLLQAVATASRMTVQAIVPTEAARRLPGMTILPV